jgi:hypothetical protein
LYAGEGDEMTDRVANFADFLKQFGSELFGCKLQLQFCNTVRSMDGIDVPRFNSQFDYNE